MDFSLHALEYQKLKHLLGRYVSTEAGSTLLEDLKPTLGEQDLIREHEITSEAMSYLREHRIPFNNIALLPQAIDKLTVAGSTLDIPEIESIQTFLSQNEGLRVRWKDLKEHYPGLAHTAHRLPDLRDLAKHLGRAIQNGEIDEKYSPNLARIRRALSATRARLTDKLESIVRSPDHAGQLQDQVITIRNGRFVIPVRTEQKRTFQGVVHGSSSSGATVFMEPLAVLEMNNEMVRLQEDERLEIARILAELTDVIQQNVSLLRHARSLAAYLEVVFAKARFGREFDCVRPVFSRGSLLSLVKARHPLLDDNLRQENSAMTPVSLDLDSHRRVLVISGPNAGGKSVVLKTVGMIALMAQSGIPVPADEATVPIFDRILADIGDQQSITDHLSTFSAHVLAIRSMFESATPQSLILLDEIGSSTEPGEGAALARAVLEQFRQIGALTVATTHYNRLKLYAETTPGVANAAMEFNEITLQPTYRLIHGLAGASSGLKIAQRLLLPAVVLTLAAGFLDSADVDAAHYVEELRQRLADLDRQQKQLEKTRLDFELWKEKELERLAEKYKTEVAQVERRLEQIVQEMSSRAARDLEAVHDDSVKKYQRKLANAKAQATAEVKREKERLQRTDYSPALDAGLQKSPTVELPREGASVRVLSLGVNGSVMTVQEGEAEVLVGNIKLRRPLSDLEVIAKSPIQLPPGVHLNVSTSKELGKNELNIVGCKVDEAVERTDKFLDDAFLAEMTQIRIVHGSGTGALRQAVTELLTGHPHVAKFEAAHHSEGGRGVTVVTLRS